MANIIPWLKALGFVRKSNLYELDVKGSEELQWAKKYLMKIQE